MASKSKVKKSKRKKTQEVYEDNLFGSDDTFAFIAGYTSGGVPYGITWEEMEETERKENEEMEKRKIIQDVDDIDLPFCKETNIEIVESGNCLRRLSCLKNKVREFQRYCMN